MFKIFQSKKKTQSTELNKKLIESGKKNKKLLINIIISFNFI